MDLLRIVESGAGVAKPKRQRAIESLRQQHNLRLKQQQAQALKAASALGAGGGGGGGGGNGGGGGGSSSSGGMIVPTMSDVMRLNHQRQTLNASSNAPLHQHQQADGGKSNIQAVNQALAAGNTYTTFAGPSSNSSSSNSGLITDGMMQFASSAISSKKSSGSTRSVASNGSTGSHPSLVYSQAGMVGAMSTNLSNGPTGSYMDYNSAPPVPMETASHRVYPGMSHVMPPSSADPTMYMTQQQQEAYHRQSMAYSASSHGGNVGTGSGLRGNSGVYNTGFAHGSGGDINSNHPYTMGAQSMHAQLANASSPYNFNSSGGYNNAMSLGLQQQQMQMQQMQSGQAGPRSQPGLLGGPSNYAASNGSNGMMGAYSSHSSSGMMYGYSNMFNVPSLSAQQQHMVDMQMSLNNGFDRPFAYRNNAVVPMPNAKNGGQAMASSMIPSLSAGEPLAVTSQYSNSMHAPAQIPLNTAPQALHTVSHAPPVEALPKELPPISSAMAVRGNAVSTSISSKTTTSAAEIMASSCHGAGNIGGRPISVHYGSASRQTNAIDIDFTVEKLPDSFLPSDVLASAVTELLSANNSIAFRSHNLPLALHYGHNYDYFASRLCQFLLRYGGRKNVSPAHVFPCSGVTEAVQSITTLLLKQAKFRANGVVLVERYIDPSIATIFTDHGVSLQSIACDSNGNIDLADLESTLQAISNQYQCQGTWPLCLYITPTGSYAAGATLSNAKRMKLLQLTEAYNLPLIADESLIFMDYTNDLDALVNKNASTSNSTRCGNKQDIVHFADFGFSHVFAIHSFSRLIAPSIRSGWIECASDAYISGLKNLGTFKSAGNSCHFGSYIVAYCMGETLAINTGSGGAISRHNAEPDADSNTAPMSCWLHDRIVIIRKALADKFLTFVSSLRINLGHIMHQFSIVACNRLVHKDSYGGSFTSVEENFDVDRACGFCVYVLLPPKISNHPKLRRMTGELPRGPSVVHGQDSMPNNHHRGQSGPHAAVIGGSRGSDRSNSIGSTGSEASSHSNIFATAGIVPTPSNDSPPVVSNQHWLVTRAITSYKINIHVATEFDATTYPHHVPRSSLLPSSNAAYNTSTTNPSDAPMFIRLCISNYSSAELELGARLLAQFLKDLL
jgi:DNA-binding transcriptional MocR family regulator